MSATWQVRLQQQATHLAAFGYYGNIYRLQIMRTTSKARLAGSSFPMRNAWPL
jgi:hypothetical protein